MKTEIQISLLKQIKKALYGPKKIKKEGAYGFLTVPEERENMKYRLKHKKEISLILDQIESIIETSKRYG